MDTKQMLPCELEHEAADEIETLRQRVKELEEGAKFFHEIENLKAQLADEKLCHEETREQLAACQHYAQQLREALSKAKEGLVQWHVPENRYRALDVINEAVSIPHDTKETLLDAHAKQVESEDMPCNPDPRAPHGFCRNASHSAGRYVCECEGWTPDEQRT
jgi:hypothetical protein